MSLFGKLIQLHSDEHRRLEDFHTEIVAHVLASDSELTLRWLRKLGVTELHETDEIAVSRQQEFERIEGLHSFGSKPDITIRVRKESRVEAIFIESKVGSGEGPGQLSKYMDQLRALPGVAQRSLVFISRDYEPKTYPMRLCDSSKLDGLISTISSAPSNLRAIQFANCLNLCKKTTCHKATDSLP